MALWLLLCFGRTLLPDSWVLALHGHAHTVDAPYLAAEGARGRLVFSPPHTHCGVEQFYQVPFAPAVPLLLPQPRVWTAYRALPPARATQPARASRGRGPTSRGP